MNTPRGDQTKGVHPATDGYRVSCGFHARVTKGYIARHSYHTRGLHRARGGCHAMGRHQTFKMFDLMRVHLTNKCFSERYRQTYLLHITHHQIMAS